MILIRLGKAVIMLLPELLECITNLMIPTTAVMHGTILSTEFANLINNNAGVDEDVVNVVEGVADAVENQADADRDATLSDRLKMAGNIRIKYLKSIIHTIII